MSDLFSVLRNSLGKRIPVLLFCLMTVPPLFAGDLNMTDFLKAAAANDPRFQGYLAENMALAWNDVLAIPAGDLVFRLSSEYALSLENPETDGYSGKFAVSKLFPLSGTTAGASLGLAPGKSSVALTLEQDIARNAFGHSTRLQAELSSFSTEIARFQTVEAWEDYFADCIRLWYDWRSARESMVNTEWGYRESLKLLDNVESRADRSVATQTEVAQARLKVLDKKDAMMNARTLYERKTRVIRYRAGIPDTVEIQPPAELTLAFEGWQDLPENREALYSLTRSGKVLKMLSSRADLTVRIRQDDLLPSVKLFGAYQYAGTGYEFENPAQTVTFGINLEYPFPGTHARAQYEAAKVSRDRNELTVADTLGRLWVDLSDLQLRLVNAGNLIQSGRERLTLTERIYRDKQLEYERGSADLEDLFSAQNAVQSARLQLSVREMERDLVLVEWYRLTDQLVLEMKQPAAVIGSP